MADHLNFKCSDQSQIDRKNGKKKTLRRSEMNTFELMPTDVTCIQ